MLSTANIKDILIEAILYKINSSGSIEKNDIIKGAVIELFIKLRRMEEINGIHQKSKPSISAMMTLCNEIFKKLQSSGNVSCHNGLCWRVISRPILYPTLKESYNDNTKS